MPSSLATLTPTIQRSRRREQQLIFVRAHLGALAGGPNPAGNLFTPDDSGQVPARVNFRLICPFCGLDVCGEHIKLMEYPVGRGLVFHTDDGHRLQYKGTILQRVECGSPIAARVV